MLLKLFACSISMRTNWRRGNPKNLHIESIHQSSWCTRNIPCDLHLEHLNWVCKTSIAGLGVNKAQAAVVYVGKALGTLFPVLQQFNEQNHVPDNAGTHHTPNSAKGRDAIIQQLQESKVFSSIHTHAHCTFPAQGDVLHAKSYTKLIWNG